MVDKRIRCKCQYDFSCRQFTKNTPDKCELYLGESCLIEQENRAASARLTLTHFREDVVNLFFKRGVADNDIIVIHFVSAFSKSLSKMIRVGLFHIDEIAFAVKT